MKKDTQDILDHIRLEAFLLSEKAGHPAGMDGFFWAQAEAMVHGRAAVVVGPGKPSKAKAETAKVAAKRPAAKKQPLPKAEKPAKPTKTPTAKRKK